MSQHHIPSRRNNLLYSISAAALILGLGLIPSAARAQEGYVGVGVGQSKAKDVSNFAACSDLAGFANLSCSTKDTDTVWRIFGGYEVNKNFAVEVGYIDLGKFTLDASFTSGGPQTAHNEVKAHGLDIDAVGTWPIAGGFSVMGRAGLFSWTADESGHIANIPLSVSTTGTSLNFGVGMKYDFAKNVGVRAEFVEYKDVGDSSTTGKSDIDVFSASFVFKF